MELAGLSVHTGGVDFDPRRPAVVLIHGAGMDHTVWRFQTRALAHAGWAALAVDLPGHGAADGPPPVSIEEMAVLAVGMLDAAGVARAAIVGHSMGSLVALEVAAAFPDRVDRLVLIATSDRMDVHPDLQTAADAADPAAVDLLVGWSHTGAARLGGHPQPGVWVRATTRRMFERHLARSLGSDLRACAAYPAGERAGYVGASTLILAGGDDRMTPPGRGRVLAEMVPGSRFVIVPDAGHMLPCENPDVVLDRLRDFLGSPTTRP